MENTTITITKETWKRLLLEKVRPSQTFDEIINDLFERYKVKWITEYQ